MTGSVSPDCDSQNDFHISDSETETASIFSVQTDCSTLEDENESQADQGPSLFVPSPAFERLRNLLQQRDKQFDLDQLNEQSPADTPMGNSAAKDGQVTMCVCVHYGDICFCILTTVVSQTTCLMLAVMSACRA